MVPNFTGRQTECQEIIGHVTSESTRIVSVWGSPGFGKTSVAIAVGHGLKSEGLPVYFLSLRGLQSKKDITSKLLSLVRQFATNDQASVQRLSLDDELCQRVGEILDPLIVILDNADDVLESGLPKVKEDVIQLLEEILRRNEKVTFIVTTRESFQFMNLNFQGLESVRIRPLNEASSQSLVHALLPAVNTSNCRRITQICGHVPLTIRLLCSLISGDSDQPSQFLKDFMKSSTESILKMLDNPDYPTNQRLQFLFDSSFHRLSAKEKEALVSLCILPSNFTIEVAAAVLGETRIFDAKKILQSLLRKSLLDSTANLGSFSMHKLIQSFAREKGEQEMKETVLNSKSRFNAFYVSLFEKLNDQFLTGHSMEAFIAFYEDKHIILTSILEGILDPRTASSVFQVLVKAEIFLVSLFWSGTEQNNFDDIFNKALQAADNLGERVYYRQLLISSCFRNVVNEAASGNIQRLSHAKNMQVSSSSVSVEEGKRLCYLGICQIVTGKTEDGIHCLLEAFPLMHGTPQQIILRAVIFQILASFYKFKTNVSNSTKFFRMAQNECRMAGDTQLLVIPPLEKQGKAKTENETNPQRDTSVLLNQPLKLEVIFLVSKAAKNFIDTDTRQYLSNTVFQILKEVETEILVSPGLFNFHRIVATLITLIGDFICIEDQVKLYKERINFHQTALKQCNYSEGNSSKHKEASISRYQVHSEALAKCYLDLGTVHQSNENYQEALEANMRSLEITLGLFGKEHRSTANSYHSLGITQYHLGDYTSALQSHKHALDVRRKLLGEEHASTADSYHGIGVTQYLLGDYTSALQSHQHALDVRRKLFGEEHADTAQSYHEIGMTQYQLGDYTSSLQSHQQALDVKRKLFGEEHVDTANSYHSLGITQSKLGDHTSALQSHKHALDVRRKLLGEEHAITADSYHGIGVTQYLLGDYTSALQSDQQALDVRRKLFGEEHANTADSYHSLSMTQYLLGDYTSALQSDQHALDVRRKLFGEEHTSTANSYHSLGMTQYQLGDYTSALQSHQHALDVRRKLLGEEHASTTDSYHGIGVTQYLLGDYTSALQSYQNALDVRRKLFGEEHADTGHSYREIGITQYQLGDYTSALQSHQHALDVRRKLFGEEHAETAKSYNEIGITQFRLGDYTSALQSHQHALDLRRKLFGEEHADTAHSYHEIGMTQY